VDFVWDNPGEPVPEETEETVTEKILKISVMQPCLQGSKLTRPEKAEAQRKQKVGAKLNSFRCL